MKRVINRKLYDTDQAEPIAKHAPNTDRSDLYYLIETLYQTSDGEYFLHCEGGAATQYAKPVSGGGTTGGAEIELLEEESALEWCEERGVDGQVVVEEFVELIET